MFFELGYASALEKPLVLTAKEGTELPFDVKDMPVIFWNPIDQKTLRDKLRDKIRLIAETQGRA